MSNYSFKYTTPPGSLSSPYHSSPPLLLSHTIQPVLHIVDTKFFEFTSVTRHESNTDMVHIPGAESLPRPQPGKPGVLHRPAPDLQAEVPMSMPAIQK